MRTCNQGEADAALQSILTNIFPHRNRNTNVLRSNGECEMYCEMYFFFISYSWKTKKKKKTIKHLFYMRFHIILDQEWAAFIQV